MRLATAPWCATPPGSISVGEPSLHPFAAFCHDDFDHMDYFMDHAGEEGGERERERQEKGEEMCSKLLTRTEGRERGQGKGGRMKR